MTAFPELRLVFLRSLKVGDIVTAGAGMRAELRGVYVDDVTSPDAIVRWIDKRGKGWQHSRVPWSTVYRGPSADYDYDVAAFNDDHNVARSCHLSRVAGSDMTECQTHHAYVRHGVPPLLRDI
jgi:hypothetical protein